MENKREFSEEPTKEIGISFIIENKEITADFFGDNRNWYQKLKKGGTLYLRTSLDTQESWDNDGEEDIPPVDPARITDHRAMSIKAFFEEYPEAKKAFLEYYDHMIKG